jgi:phosphatidylserine/phosphatidylglycerophosphate/cardiolipin synthase-like enzyme
MLEIANHAVPVTGVIMKVRKHNKTNVIDEDNCNEVTILSGGRNFIELITGPPKIDSTQPGT